MLYLRRLPVVVTAVVVLIGYSAGGVAESPEKTPESVIREARAAVAELRVVRSTPHHVGTGTGFFISHDGRLLTNWHVVRDAKAITVRTASGRTLTGIVLAEDRKHDLAVVQIIGDDFPSLELADTDTASPGLP